MKSAGQRQAYYGRSSCSSNTNNVEAPPYGKYYQYSSGPALSHADRTKKARADPLRPLHPRRNSGNGPCHNSHAENIRTKGPHEFYNMMWDPTVYRGNSYKTYEAAEIERCKRKKAAENHVKRRKYPKNQKKIGGILKPVLHLDSEKHGFEDMGIQTEEFLEELTSNSTIQDMCTQVEPDMQKIRGVSNILFKPFTIGVTSACQTDCELSCPFEENYNHIQKILTKKILEQSLLETAEEAELEFIRKEKRHLVQSKRDEASKMRRQVDAQRQVTEERSMALALQKRESAIERDAESRVGAALFASACVAGVVPTLFGILQAAKPGTQDSQEQLNDDVVENLRKKKVASRRFMDGLLYDAASSREAEMADEMFKIPLSSSSQPRTSIVNPSSANYGQKEKQSLAFPNYSNQRDDKNRRSNVGPRKSSLKRTVSSYPTNS